MQSVKGFGSVRAVKAGWVTETSSADSTVQMSIKIGHQTVYLRSYPDMTEIC